MDLFSCRKCAHFVNGPAPRCQRGLTLVDAAGASAGATLLVVIEQGCDEFTLSLKSAEKKATKIGGPRPALREAAGASRSGCDKPACFSACALT
jgi:hypothetical protein